MIITPAHERKSFSQFGEDGILATILNEIGDGAKKFIEIGCGDGRECNTKALREERGFSGVMVDCAHENEYVSKRFVTAENVQQVLRELKAPQHPDVFSLDIDGIDWYVLRNIGPYVPRVLVCEFNATWGPDECMAIPYDPDFKWQITRYFGASSMAFHKLANELGLSLVYSNPVNMFFVERDECHHFDNADDPKVRFQQTWSHLPDNRMEFCIDPFTVKSPEPLP